MCFDFTMTKVQFVNVAIKSGGGLRLVSQIDRSAAGLLEITDAESRDFAFAWLK